MRRRRLLGGVVLAALAAAAPAALEAHVVPQGVGSQSEIRIRPRRVSVRFNLGFSNLLAIREYKKVDLDRNNVIDRAEQETYLKKLGPELVEKIRCHVDGKEVKLRIVRHHATGMLGPIEALAFDTFFDLEGDVALGPGPHELKYFEGNYMGEESQQILWVPQDRVVEDFANFNVEQEVKGAPIVEEGNAWKALGRDLTIQLAFDPKALERDRAEALIEPALRGLQATIDGLATSVARAAEEDLSALAFDPVKLGRDERLLLDRPGFLLDRMPVAQDRSAPAPQVASGGTSPERLENPERVTRDDETSETKKLIDMSREGFSLAVILAFFVAGMWHAMGAGHGKTMVAAYLLGTSGRVWDAVRLGLIVTFTHTFTLYTFGLGLVYVFERFKENLAGRSEQQVQALAIFYLTLLSGLGLVVFGLGLARNRWRAAKRAEAGGASPSFSPPTDDKGRRLALVAPAPVDHDHDHGHDHSHDHGHGHHHHHHEGMDEAAHGAAHAREAQTVATWGDLISLGLTGGIVPCPAGIALIIYSLHFAKENTLRCFIYLVAFSLGLGAVLVAIATAMVFSRRFLQGALETKGRRRALLLLPVASAIVVSLLGWTVVYEAFDPGFKRLISRVKNVATRS